MQLREMAAPSWRQEQFAQVAHMDGFIAALDQTCGNVSGVLRLYGVNPEQYDQESDVMDRMHEMRGRIVTHPIFNNSRIIGMILSEAGVYRHIGNMTTAQYLWEQKRVVPFVKIDKGLMDEACGAQMMKDVPDLDKLLDKAWLAGVFGTTARSVIRHPDQLGIQAVVRQQFEVARRVMAKGLVPILEVEVDNDARDKDQLERWLLDELMAGLQHLQPEQKLLFRLALPTRPNLYLPLASHPNAIRVTALTGSRGRDQACELLTQNANVVAAFSRAFVEGLTVNSTDEEFTMHMDISCEAIYRASHAVPDQTEQWLKVTCQDGFFAALDQSGGSTPKALKKYGLDESAYTGEAEMMDRVHEMRTRIITNRAFNGSRIVGAILFEATMDRDIGGMPAARYLWQEKRVVPFLKIDKGLAQERDGVQLMREIPDLEAVLDKAMQAGIFGTKARSVIKCPDAVGIGLAVAQQFDIGRRVIAKGLVPILEPEVDINAPDKEHCEELLFEALRVGLGKLGPCERVMFKLTPPTKANLYLPLTSHPNTARVLALSGGYSRAQACQLLAQNIGVIASFSRALTEGLLVSQAEDEFTKVLDESCEAIYQASRSTPTKVEQMVKVRSQDGFIAALDQSGGSTPKALRLYGSEFAGEAEMMDRIHEMRARIFTSRSFHGARIIGAILFEDTVDRDVGGMPTAKYLWEQKRVVPFLKIDKGLAEEKNGVQLMKDIPRLEETLHKAVKAGIFGTKARSVIKHPNPEGIKAVVEQQLEIARKVISSGLVPIVEPEVDIGALEKANCEWLLAGALMDGLRNLSPNEKVIFKLTLPTQPNLYLPLMAHPNTIRLAALSGGYSRAQACELLAENVGMIASFSRALTEGLHAAQTEEQFEQALDDSCEAIYKASRANQSKVMQLAKVAKQEGFFVAFDQSGSSALHAIRTFGVPDTAYKNKDEMMELVHNMHQRIVTNPAFHGSRVIGAILSEESLLREIEGMPLGRYLWEQKSIVPFVRIDRGLEDVHSGVQLMKDLPDLEEQLGSAARAGIFGTKARSVIRFANEAGIKALVEQQLELARRVCARGLVPIIEPEVDMESSEKLLCEEMLLRELAAGLEALAPTERVMLRLTFPTTPDLYSSLTWSQPRTLRPQLVRVTALSGGLPRERACELLAGNVGMGAAFGRAFVEGLTGEQSDEEFAKAIDEAAEAILRATRRPPERLAALAMGGA